MKKTSKMLIVAIVCALFAVTTKAQGVYVKVGAGYGLPAGTQTGFNTDQSMVTDIYKTEVVNYSFGKGLNFAGTFGAMFNKNLGMELGIGYLIGSKTEFTDNYTTTGSTSKSTSTMKSKMLFFVPALVIESGFEKINPYARLGLVVALPKVTNEDERTVSSTYSSTTHKSIEKTDVKMDLGLGANAALGILFNLSDNFAIFGECNINALSITPKSSEITESSTDGVDNLSSMTTSEKETVYEKSVTEDPLNPPSDSEPSKSVKFKLPFSSVGANIGVKISF